MSRHVALVRGINVGGHRRVPMATLRERFAAAGATDVATYIQSGNVVFSAPPRGAPAIASAVQRDLESMHGGSVPVVTRSAAAWRRILASLPFTDLPEERSSVSVGLLDRRPTAARAAALDPDHSPGDRFVLDGTTLYLDLPRGVRETGLTVAWFERELGVSCTVRNWRTMLALRDRLDAPA